MSESLYVTVTILDSQEYWVLHEDDSLTAAIAVENTAGLSTQAVVNLLEGAAASLRRTLEQEVEK